MKFHLIARFVLLPHSNYHSSRLVLREPALQFWQLFITRDLLSLKFEESRAASEELLYLNLPLIYLLKCLPTARWPIFMAHIQEFLQRPCRIHLYTSRSPP
jgi:hypothetical protein